MDAEIDARQEFLDVTRRRFLLELATPLDTLQAAVSLANLQPDKRRRETDLRQAGQELNVLLGRDPLTPVSVQAEFPIETADVPQATALRWARQRPDVRRQQLQSDLLRIQRGVQKANNHPYLTLEGSYGYVGRDLDTIADQGHDFWRTSVTVTWPLWDGQVVKGQVQQTEASLRRSEHALDDRRRRAEAEVLQALDDLQVARTDLAAADLNMDRAERAFEQVNLRYELGKADQLDVLNAQSERYAARSNLLRARYQVLTMTATLKRAMGRSPLEPLAGLTASHPSLESSP
jgi:outer membrane protein TolC